MKNTDLIVVNITGTNGSTRNQRTVTRVFDGTGTALNDQGKPAGLADTLRNLPTEGSIKAPDFPAQAYAAAQQKGEAGIAEGMAILKAFQEQVQAVEASANGGSTEAQIAKSVLAYLEEFHGFKQTDGDHFVIKLDDIDVTRQTLPDGRSSYLVAGSAVFGA